VHTDHETLTHLLWTKEPIGQQSRWLDLLGEFHLTIQHRPSSGDSNSDALSRRPCLHGSGTECKQCSWTIWLPEVQSPGIDSAPPVVDSISPGIGSTLLWNARLVEIQSQDDDAVPSVADSIVNPNATNPHSVSDVPMTSPVDVGTVEIVTVDVHAAWDAEESRLTDPADDIEAQRSSPGVGDIQQLPYDRTHDHMDRTDSIEHNPAAATHVQEEDVRQVETPSADGSYVDLDSIHAAQAEDDSVKVVMDYLSAGQAGLDGIDIRQYPEEARQLFGQWESLVIQDGVLYQRFYHTDGVTKFLEVVLPAVLHRAFVEKIHAELGHFGRVKTALAVSSRAYFPAWRSFTHLVIRNCSVCNRLQWSKQPQKQTKLKPMTEFRPVAVLHADLVGPFPPGRNCQGQRGFQYILSVVDSATRCLSMAPSVTSQDSRRGCSCSV